MLDEGLSQKRVYVQDVSFMGFILEKGFAYASDLAERFCTSVRMSNYTLSKLESLGWVERVGRRKCPFQWYRVPLKIEAEVLEIASKVSKSMKELPHRKYFNVTWKALRYSSKLVGDSLRGGGSIPFEGVSLACGARERASVWWLPVVVNGFWVLDEFSLDVVEFWGLGDVVDDFLFGFVEYDFS
jgi:hypothetical protein